jgi:platelet-activating factor acetylhydrolase
MSRILRPLAASAATAVAAAAAFASAFPSFSSSSASKGPLLVGATRARLRSDAPDAQIFYPAAPRTSPFERHPLQYMRPAAMEGLAEWLKLPQLMFRHLTRAAHPCAVDSEPLPPPADSRGWPVVVFSHGLGGNNDVYVKTCSDLASRGMVVVSLDHEDGSGSYANTEAGFVVRYTPVPAAVSQGGRAEAVAWRAPFLRKRCEEVAAVARYVQKKGSAGGGTGGGTTTATADASSVVAAATAAPSAVAEAVLRCCDRSSVVLGGHSFGGASTVMAHHALLGEGLCVKGCFLHDVWPLPIPEESLDRGMQVPSITLLGDSFSNNAETHLTKRLVGNSNASSTLTFASTNTKTNTKNMKNMKASSSASASASASVSASSAASLAASSAASSASTASLYNVVGSEHQSYSDAVFWYPEWLLRNRGSLGAASPAETQVAIVDATATFVLSLGGGSSLVVGGRSSPRLRDLTVDAVQ